MAINNNSLEQLLEAIDIIASQRASENNAYDQTIICTIVDNSKAEQYGYYTVTNDTLTFQAYSDNLTYKVGNYVRVSIPNGDYSQQKYITGLYQYNTGEAVSYVSPLDTFMGISTLIDKRATPASDKLVNQPIGLIANGNDNSGNDIPPVIIGSADASMQASGMYDTIGLQADFKCALGSQYNLCSGSYGLQLDLTIKLDGTNQTVIHSIYMDSANFFGDPYNFKVYSTQAQTYDISNLGGTIVSFVAKPYQRDDFTYETNGTIVRLPASKQEANIFVANIYVALGNDLYKVENHTVKLYTNNSLSYKHSSENGDLEALNTKTLSVLYYNKDENNEYIGFNDGRWTDKNNSYNELQYLGAVEDDRRLRGQRGTDISDTFGTLDMLDRYYKILPVIDETIGYVETTVVRTLQSLKRELTGCGAVNAIVDDWIKTLEDQIDSAKNTRKNLVEGIFTKDGKVIEEWKVSKIEFDFFSESYYPMFQTIDDKVVFAPEIKEKVTNNYPQYRSIYEDYAKQMIEIKARVEEACNRIAIETGKMYDCEATQGLNFKFVEKDFSVYDNYYDIFWYRENPTYAEPDRFMPTGWEPISQNDIGLPTEQDPDKPGYLVKYCPNERNNITIVLNGDTKKERFRVVIVHNHNCYYSNILEFTNVDEFAEEEIMTSEAIELKHGKHSRESYQMLYSSGYQLINRADARLDRAIELACKGEFGGNESLCGATVYWYIPANLTMLTYDEELLTTSRELQYDDEQELKVTIEPLIKLDERETEGPYQYFRPGYHCFYKKVAEKPVENADSKALNKWAAALTEDLKFYYNIKENLVPCNVHNDIECVVVLDDKNKTTLETSIRVVFGALGTNGTNYSLVVMPATKQYCVTNNDPMPIDIALYDYDGNWVEDATFQTSWNGPTNYTTYKDNQVSMTNPNQVGMTKPDEENPNNDTGVGILTVKTTIDVEKIKEGGRDRIVDLFVQYPISWGKNKGDYIAGATTITYNSNGSNPEYYKGPYVLYDKNHQEQTGVEWVMEWYDGSQKPITAQNNKFYGKYMPVLTNNNTIVPSPMYVTGCECYPVVVAIQNGDEVWRQPIVITQNRYPSQYLNQWDGSLEIDENNGTIMSNLVGAGKKEADNSFSGVLMGEVAMKAKIDPEKDPVQNHNHSGLGLYGFHYGAQSFGFNVDGTAFIGKSGGGRISFDGNQGFIYSDNWLQSFEEGSKNKAFIPQYDGSNNITHYELGESTDGMAIDLRNGHIDANNFRLRSENIKLSSGKAVEGDNYYFVLGNDNNFIKMDGDGDLTIQVSDLTIGDKSLQDALKATTVSPENVANALKEFDGIIEKDGKFYLSSHYIHIKDSSGGTLFLADGTNNTNNKVEIAGWNVTNDALVSRDGAITISNKGIACLASSPNLELVSISQYTIYTSSYYPQKAYITNWHSSTAWYNFAYKITSQDKFVVTTNTSSNIEFYLMKDLPTGATTGYTHPYLASAKSVNQFPINGADYYGYYLVINKSGSSLPIDCGKTFFSVTPTGGLYAEDAEISGNITATTLVANQKGEIGGWEISQSMLSSPNSEVVFNSSKSLSDYAIAVKDKFLVKFDGTIKATGAIIEGDIEATTLTANQSGYIAGWQIAPSSLHNKKIYLSSGNGPTFDSLINFDENLQPQSNGVVLYTSSTDRYIGIEKVHVEFVPSLKTLWTVVDLPEWALSNTNVGYGYAITDDDNFDESFKSVYGDNEDALGGDFTMRFSKGNNFISYRYFSIARIVSNNGQYQALFQLLTKDQLGIAKTKEDHPLFKSDMTYEEYCAYVRHHIEFEITLNKCGKNFMLLEDGSVYMNGMNCGSWDFGGASPDGSYIRGTHTDDDGFKHRVWLYSEVLKYTKFKPDGNIEFTAGCTWEDLFKKLATI